MTKRVLLFEYATGGGAWEDVSLLAGDSPFLQEGAMMVRALLADLSSLADVEVVVLWDARLPSSWLGPLTTGTQLEFVASVAQWRVAIETAAQTCTETLLVAPECGGVLERLTDRAAQAGLKLACPQGECVRLASDKHATCEWLLRAGVRCPAGVRLGSGDQLPESFSYPAVLKPVDGAGAAGVRTIKRASSLARCPQSGVAWRLENFVAGRAASVLLLRYDSQGTNRVVALPAAWQRLESGETWSYLGGETPIDASYAERAVRLALQTAEALPSWRGLLGVDLVLGADASGADDWVIEVNPRVTTSYVGVRQILRGNALSLLFGVESDESVVQMRPGASTVRWTTDQFHFAGGSALQ